MTAVSVVPEAVALNCSAPPVTTEAVPGEMDTETAALATPLSSEHAEKDKDRENSESFKERYFKKISS